MAEVQAEVACICSEDSWAVKSRVSRGAGEFLLVEGLL
jgi:hypothetical protein